MQDKFRDTRQVVPSSPPGCCAACIKPSEQNNMHRPYHHHDNDESDMVLAKEMSQLSVEERERVFDEIHGVAAVQNETPEFLATHIQQMNEALLKIPKNRRKALDRAILYRPGIVQDKKLKLMFLRADAYDGKKAAKRLVQHFENKLALFGQGKLSKRITLDDLEKGDLELLNSIGCVILPHRDQTGRPIWFFDISRYDFDRMESLFRCFWYQVMATVEDDEIAQLKGVCDVAYAPGHLHVLPASASKYKSQLAQSDNLISGLPCRITTFHICYDDPIMKSVMNMGRLVLRKEIRLRIRTHYGSDLEMQYSLMTFGIHCQSLFRTTVGEDKRKEIQLQYIQRRRAAEQQQEQERVALEDRTGVIVYPEPDDVLLHRGRPYQMFSGNQRFAKLIDRHNEKYHRLCNDKFAKTCLSMDMVKTVQAYGGRFLEKRNDDDDNDGQLGWTVVDDVMAREKAAVAFRSRVSKVSKTPHSSDRRGSSSQSKRLRYDPSFQQF